VSSDLALNGGPMERGWRWITGLVAWLQKKLFMSTENLLDFGLEE
jgi:hypothetical protein